MKRICQKRCIVAATIGLVVTLISMHTLALDVKGLDEVEIQFAGLEVSKIPGTANRVTVNCHLLGLHSNGAPTSATEVAGPFFLTNGAALNGPFSIKWQKNDLQNGSPDTLEKYECQIVFWDANKGFNPSPGDATVKTCNHTVYGTQMLGGAKTVCGAGGKIDNSPVQVHK